MKRYQSLITGWPLAIVLAVTTGCSSNPDDLAGTSGNETTAPLLTRGIVSTDNGLTIGGQSLSLQTATVRINGESGSTSSLKEGMWVTVGRVNGVVQTIRYDEDIYGPIDVVEQDGTLNVLGQRVEISSSTHFDESTSDLPKSGDIVEISGLRDSNHYLIASRIELDQSATGAWSVRGQITQLNRSLSVFFIGGLTVDYSLARFDDMDESSLENGLEVEIIDESRSYEPGSLYLHATRIENHETSVIYPSSSSSSSSVSSSNSNPTSVTTSTTNSSSNTSSNTSTISSSNTSTISSSNTNSSSDVPTSSDGDSNVLTEVDIDNIEVEIEGIVASFDASIGTLDINGFEITTSFSTEYQLVDHSFVSRDEFFAMLQQGISVIKIKWRSYIGYDQPPHELELESR